MFRFAVATAASFAVTAVLLAASLPQGTFHIA